MARIQKKKKIPAARSAVDLKYHLYENCVQSEKWQMRYLPKFHRRFTGREAYSMREDFCGTGRIACAWVKKSPKHRAVGLDLDPEPLEYGMRVNRSKLSADAQSRVDYLRQDVRKPTKEKFDIIGAHNFSFYIFHERCDLLDYAKAAYASLKPKGTFFLEMAGGDGFVTPGTDREKIDIDGIGKVEYVWEQHACDSVTKIGDYSIHFKLPEKAAKAHGRGSKLWMNDEFTYNWRLWEIRETREILKQAGFRETAVLWPTDDTMTDYMQVEQGDGSAVWLAYVVGIR